MGFFKETRRILGEVAYFLMGLVLVGIFLLIFSSLTIPAGIYWTLNKLWGKIFRPDLELSESYCHLMALDDYTKDSSLNITAVVVVTGRLDPETVRRRMVDNVLPMKQQKGDKLEFRRLKQYPVFYGGLMHWKEDQDFDITNHVRANDCTGVGKKPFDDNDLSELLSTLQTQPWKEKQSLWEMIIVNDFVTDDDYNLEEGAGYTELSLLVYRIHHCMADGYGIMKVMTSNFDGWENLSAYMSPVKMNPCMKTLMQMALPLQFVLDFSKFVILRWPRDDNEWVVKPNSGFKRQFTTVYTNGIKLERFKNVKNKFRVSLQAVMNAVSSGVIRRLMEDQCQLVPKNATAFMPTPLPNHPGGMRVHATAAFVKLPIGEVDPVERLRLAFKHLNAILKKSTLPFTLYKFLIQLNKLPAKLLKPFPTKFRASLGMSCMPGPAKSGYLSGHRALGTFYAAGTSYGPVGCAITILTHRNRANLVFNIVANIYPESRELLRKKVNFYANEELKLLENAPAPASIKNGRDVVTKV